MSSNRRDFGHALGTVLPLTRQGLARNGAETTAAEFLADPLATAKIRMSPPAFTNKASHRRPALPALTGIRFFAAMAVFFFHFGAALSVRLGAPTIFTQLLRNGYIGVSLFFVLSGFIMTYTYEGQLSSTGELVDYAWARFARIYPVYILALIVAIPVLERPITWLSGVKVLLMVQSWALPTSSSGYSWVTQAWTLSVELFFYLMFPLLLRAFRSSPNVMIWAMTLTLGAIIVSLGIPTITPGYNSTQLVWGGTQFIPLPLLRFSEFTFGFALCKWMLGNRDLASRISNTWLVATVLAVAIYILCWQSSPQAMGCVTLLFGVLTIQLASASSPVERFLSRPWLTLLGGASYAIYLLQGPIHGWCHWLLPEPWVRPTQLIASIGGAIFTFLFFEEPARVAIRRWHHRRFGGLQKVSGNHPAEDVT